MRINNIATVRDLNGSVWVIVSKALASVHVDVTKSYLHSLLITDISAIVKLRIITSSQQNTQQSTRLNE